MREQYANLKLWVSTRRNLKLISALTGLSIVEIAEALAINELRRIQDRDNHQSVQNETVTDKESGALF